MKTVQIDRSEPFDPKTFIGEEWTIVEQDERSIALTEIDPARVVFETTSVKRKKMVAGKDRLRILRSRPDLIRLDAAILKVFYENQMKIPAKWKEQTNARTTYIYFDGTILRNHEGKYFVLCLYWHGGKWRCGVDELEDSSNSENKSAVIQEIALSAA